MLIKNGLNHVEPTWGKNRVDQSGNMCTLNTQQQIFKQSSKTQYLVDLVTLVSLMAQPSYIWIRALVVVTILLFLVKMLLADQIDPFGHRDHSAPMQAQSQLQSQHSFPSTDQIDPFGHRDHSAPMQVQPQLHSQHSFPSTPPSSPSTSTPPSSPSTADASVVRDCEHLFEEDNCDFKVEQGRKFDCKYGTAIALCFHTVAAAWCQSAGGWRTLRPRFLSAG